MQVQAPSRFKKFDTPLKTSSIRSNPPQPQRCHPAVNLPVGSSYLTTVWWVFRTCVRFRLVALLRYKQTDVGWVLLHPVQFLRKLAQEDKLSSAFWLCVFGALNAFVFFYTLGLFYQLVADTHAALLDGSVDLSVSANRGIVRFGYLSRAGPWAKGNTLAPTAAAAAAARAHARAHVLPLGRVFFF